MHGLMVVCYRHQVAPQTQKFRCPQCEKGEAHDTWSAEHVKRHLDEHHSDYYDDDWPHVQVDTHTPRGSCGLLKLYCHPRT